MPAIQINVITNLIGSLGVFDVIMALTGGGPGYTTESIGVYIYHKSFDGLMGYATSVAVLLFFIMLLPVAVALYLTKRGTQCILGRAATAPGTVGSPYQWLTGHRIRRACPLRCAPLVAGQAGSSYLAMILMALISIIPFYVLVFLAISPPSVSFYNGQFFPTQIDWQNFSDAWQSAGLGTAVVNSAIITGGTVILAVLASASAGYAFARFPNWFHRVAFGVLLFSMLVPLIINTVPLYILMREIGGIDTYWAMILLLTTGSIPIATFLYRNFILSMSPEMEEAALVDGCTRFTAFWRITFPLLKPVTSTVIILVAVGAWNNYAQAIFFLQDPAKATVPLAVSSFFQSFGANYTGMAAAALMGMLPAILVFFVFQRYFIKGIVAGSIKGSRRPVMAAWNGRQRCIVLGVLRTKAAALLLRTVVACTWHR